MKFRLMVRITVLTLLVSGLLLAVGVAGAWYIQNKQRDISDSLLWNLKSMRAAEELEIALREMGRQLNQFLATGERRHLQEILDLRRETDWWLTQARRLGVDSKEASFIARATRSYGPFFEAVRDLAGQTPAKDLRTRVRKLDRALYTDILPPIHDYLDFNEEEVEQNAEENQGLAGPLVFGLLLLGACGTGAGLVAGFGIARGVSRSIVQLSVPIRDAAGKLSEVVGPITVSAGWALHKAEALSLGELQGILHDMAGKIGTVIDRLQKSQREVLRAEQLAAVGQLAAGMAHELRNPLMAMKVLIQAAADRDGGLAGRDLAVLEEEITRLEHLIRTFLDFARPPRLEKRTFEVQGVLDQTVKLVSGRAARQGVGIELQGPGEPVRAEADMGQVRQVVLNLLMNALDALPAGGTVWVRTATEGDPAGRRWLTIRVADNGAGLPAELGQQIFEPFVSTKDTGVGLGLSVCRRIVEAHGGTITAADRPGGGAIFVVRLPLPAAPEPCLPAGAGGASGGP
jgi:signal transduction histidine kinase